MIVDWETSLCILCDVVEGELSVPYNYLFPNRQVNTQILLETQFFIVIPDIGPIVEGYTLIVSKRHVPAMRDLPQSELNELNDLVDAVRDAIKEVYGESIVFEHGEDTFVNNAGACIDHAHLHIVPLNPKLSLDLSDIQFTKMENSESWKQLCKTGGYLYYKNQRNEAFYAQVNQCKQQYIRRKLTKTINLRLPWNWRDFIRFADVLQTRALIDDCINKLSEPIERAWIACTKDS